MDYLIENGCEVVVLDDFSSGSLDNLRNAIQSKMLKIVKGSIMDEDKVKEAHNDVEVVFHEASIVSVQRSRSEPEFTNKINVEGTRRILAQSSRVGVKRVVLASSAAVYGDPPSLPVLETTPTVPISPYGISKLNAERECMEASNLTGLETVILRYFNVYGPRSVEGHDGGVITEFANRIRSGKSLIIYGDGNQTRDFVFVNDVVQANILAMGKRGASGKCFNVGSGNYISIRELAELEARILSDGHTSVGFENMPSVPGDVVHSYCDISYIRSELRYEPKFSLDAGLRQYFAVI